jgi:hypothetical protein
MPSILKTSFKKTSAVLDELTDGPRIAPDYAFPVVAPIVLAVAAATFGAYLATETGRAILGELRRRQRLREKRPDSPSLRGSPTPEGLEADAALVPRTLAIRLRLGSRLADLEPTLSSGISCKSLKNGQKRIQSRAPGLKGWLSDRHVTVNYSTLVRYKKLAQRLRQLLALDDRLPLEWLLPDMSPSMEIPSDLHGQYAAGKERLARLMREHRNFSRLSRHVEEKLGIPQLLAVRRARVRERQDRWANRRIRRLQCSSTTVHAKCQLRVTGSTPERVEATKREFLRFLRDKNLPAPLEHLRRKALHWLGTLDR